MFENLKYECKNPKVIKLSALWAVLSGFTFFSTMLNDLAHISMKWLRLTSNATFGVDSILYPLKPMKNDKNQSRKNMHSVQFRATKKLLQNQQKLYAIVKHNENIMK